MFKGHEITRRSLLAGLAAATAAAAAASVPAAASVTMAPENPALLGLADTLAAGVGEVHAARADYAACVETWAKLWPSVPEAIRFPDRYAPAKNFEGAAIREDGRAVCVMTAANIEADMASIRKAVTRKRKDPAKPFYANASNYYWGQSGTIHDWQAVLDELAGLKAIAVVYEAEMARIHAASGFDAKARREGMATRTLKATIDATLAERPETVEGLLIQAQAMEAVQLLDPWQRANAALTSNWGADFAASLIRISTAA